MVNIVSGGQTGVDRAALDTAIEAGIPHGGYCPKGRLAEDGQVPAKYELTETDSRDYAARTKQNVIESDATLIFSRGGHLEGGTAKTREFAIAHERPVLVIDEATPVNTAITDLVHFEKDIGFRTLNVAGPRESEAPNLGAYVQEVLAAFFCSIGTAEG